VIRRRALLIVSVAAIVACQADVAEERRAIRIDDRAWEVIVGDPDGMRGRPDFGGADGMLFDHSAEVDPAAIVYVMDGVSFPLDIAWFDGGGALVGTARMATCPVEPCPQYASPGPFRWAVEAPVGAFDDLPADAELLISS
jgi:uncharacterized membrane protein (UPF0127 family)